MKNPLHKRLPKELLGDIGKYLAVFLFMTATIAFVSGFLVADNSMLKAYNESFETYNIEDGHFELAEKANDVLKKEIEKEGVKLYSNAYIEKDTDHDRDGKTDSTLRVFAKRDKVNKVCLMEGTLPKKQDEIAIDRMYAQNNHIKVSDIIKVGTKNLKVTGFVALSDYSALFQDNGDMMFDAVKFGTAVMTQKGFQGIGSKKIRHSYSWKYNKAPSDEVQEKKKSDKFLEALGSKAVVTDYVPRYLNQAIQFTGNDMGGDKSMMVTLLYILIVIMAFVFAVTANNTITKESAVIGTLRASGYTRGELLGHYISIPVFVTFLAALVGNILGYTVMKDVCAGMYYGSYSLPLYETRWNAEAFVLTTVIPLLIMLAVNMWMIYRKLKFSPLKFLRRDLSRVREKKAVRLPEFKFFRRFRLRIIFQNAPSYATLFIGIVFANVLLLFGMMVSPLLSHYQQSILDHMPAKYQYVLKAEKETGTKGAEKFAVSSLKTIPGRYESEDVSVYGIQKDSSYFSAEFPEDGIYISDGYAEKYSLGEGDSLTLKESYGKKKYTFKIRGVYEYPSSVSVFMSLSEYRDVFDESEEYFNGYLSDKKIKDVDENYIASVITEEDLTKLSRQLDVSMGSLFILVNIFAVILFAMLIYLLTKLIIEKNACSISMVKILGYENREISSLYLTATTWVVVLSTALSLVLSTGVLKLIYRPMMEKMNGWLSFYVNPVIYPEMFLMGMAAYAAVAWIQFRKIRRVPMDEALKNVE